VVVLPPETIDLGEGAGVRQYGSDEIPTVTEAELEILYGECPERPPMVMFQKTITTPRSYLFFAREGKTINNYKFTGSEHVPPTRPAPEYITRLMDWANRKTGTTNYHHALVNFYRGTEDYIGPHSDAEGQLVPDSDIFSFSFGDQRRFRVEGKRGQYKFEFQMPHNTCVVMQGSMQRKAKHSVPKMTAKEKEDPERKHVRINVTLRAFKEQ